MGAELHLAHACHGGVLRRLQAEAAEEEERRALHERHAMVVVPERRAMAEVAWSGMVPERHRRR